MCSQRRKKPRHHASVNLETRNDAATNARDPASPAAFGNACSAHRCHRTRGIAQHRLGPLNVPGVTPVTALGRMLVIPQMLAHLLLEHGLDNKLCSRLQQPARVGQRHTRRPGLTHLLTRQLQLLLSRGIRLGLHRRPRQQPTNLPGHRRAARRGLRLSRLSLQLLRRGRHVHQCHGHHNPFRRAPPGRSGHLHRFSDRSGRTACLRNFHQTHRGIVSPLLLDATR